MIEYKLKELLEIKNGRDYKHLKNGNIPVYGSGGLMRYVDEHLYEGKSILLPRKGTLSNIQYVDKAFWTVDTIYYSIVDENKADPYYLYNYIKLLDLSHLNTGTGVPSMTFGAYYDVPVNLPDLSTQKQIAKVLSDLDIKIEINNKINQELEAMAKTLYDYWFVQFDFPCPEGLEGLEHIAGKPYKSSGGLMVFNEELKREIPEGWEVKEINKVIKVKDGTHDSPKSIDKGFKLVTSKHLKLEGLDFEKANSISEEDYININKRSQVETGDILYSMIGNIGTVYKVEEKKIDFAIKNVALYKTSSSQKLKNYIYMFLKGYDMQKYMGNVIAGSIQKFIGLGSLRKMPIMIDEETICNYEKKTNSIFDKINNLKLENQKLSELRDWLLPMLMNGQVRVVNSDKSKND